MGHPVSQNFPRQQRDHNSVSCQSSHRHSSPKKSPKIPADIESPPFYLPLQSFNSRYRAISNLGSGSFGDVTLAKIKVDINNSQNFKTFKNTLMERGSNFKDENFYNKKTGLVAIKTMTKRLPLLNDYTRIKEIRFILSIPSHKNLVQIYEMFIDNTDFKLHIAMECMDQNLYQLIKSRKHNRFSHQTLKSILSQILSGIRHIHDCDYFHRDIKPENILVSPANRFYGQDYLSSDAFKHPDNFIVKIADYGLARHIDNKRPYTSYVSTRWYRAPEILLRKNWYSRPVDIWAFGSVACEVATFRPLFPGGNEYEQTWKVLDLLGTPVSRNSLDNYYPSYGYWDEALFLSTELGFNFPQKKCVDITHIVQNPQLSALCDVIRACLAWNPTTRADVNQICKMPYFRGTCVDDYADRTATEPISINKRPTFTNQINKSETLLGIKPKSTSKVPVILGNNPSFQENAINTSYNSTSSTNAVNLSLFNDSDAANKESQINQMNDLHTVPNLTQESIQSTNDENYNSNAPFVFKNLHSDFHIDQHVTHPIQSIAIDSNHSIDSPFSKNAQHYNSAFQEYTYQPMNMGHLDERHLDPPVTQSEDFIDWDRLEKINNQGNQTDVSDSMKGFSNLDHLLVENDLASSDDRIMKNYSGIQEGYGKTGESEFQIDGNSLKSDQFPDSEFSATLYSKFNLRRIPKDSQTTSNNSCIVDYNNSFDTY